MILNVVILLFLMVMACWWGMGRGLLEAFLHMVMTVVAASLAVALWEPTVVWGLMHVVPSYAWGVGLVGLFVVWLLIFRVIAGFVITKRVYFHPAIEVIGGGLCGLASGVLASGVLVIGLSFLPLPTGAGGYKPMVLKPNGQAEYRPLGQLWLPVDQYSNKILSKLSNQVFSSRNSLALYRPRLAQQAALFRVSHSTDQSIVMLPDGVSDIQVYALPTPVQELGSLTSRRMGRRYRTKGTILVVVDTQWTMRSKMLDSDRTLRIQAPHVRLITHRTSQSTTTAQMHAPVGWSRVDANTGRRVFVPVNITTQSAVIRDNQDRLAWSFLISGDEEVSHLLLRNLRLELPVATADREALVSVVGQLKAAEISLPNKD